MSQLFFGWIIIQCPYRVFIWTNDKMYFKPSRKNKDFVFLPVSILTSKEIIPAYLFSFPLRIWDPKKDSKKIIMEWFHQKLMEVMLDNWLCLVLFTWMYYPLCLFLRPSLSVRQIWQLNFPRYVGWHHPRVGRDPWFGMQVFLSSEYYVYPLPTYLFTWSIINLSKDSWIFKICTYTNGG